ncbi:ubiquitin-like-conjugating enzyme ATG10 isoform X2 [Silurus meridionalis]|uniref:ubiquitin-like-conjugating enzyme ATG10 isoform X2 n=1 Tax=Silurus meridionalis TaxID=175797 RepID=UPI001EEB51FE|nr:ubiquitin-like-conjugating enzyme ATG10 isoform X2 [Silurus meridionalis]
MRTNLQNIGRKHLYIDRILHCKYFSRVLIKQMSSGEVSNISSYCLDEKSFHLCCKLFLQHSGVIRDGWSWADVKGSEEGYVKKTAIIPAKLGSLLNHKADDGMNAVTGVDECDDEAVGDYIVQSQVLVHYEYHILYSIGHQVPILYFRASTLDGQPLSLDEVWSNIHPNYRQRLLQGPWDTLTQQEHPFLGQPFFMLHPCHTEEFMKPLLQMADDKKRKINYITTWLSVVGPVVGLDVPLSYHTELPAPD